MARPVAYFALTIVIDEDGFHTVGLLNGRIQDGRQVVDGNRGSGPVPPGDAAVRVRELADVLAGSFADSHAKHWPRPEALEGTN
jgi:hypothetical protein